MFLKCVWYNMKIVVKKRDTFMWLMLFPIILSTLFYFAISGLTNTTLTYAKSNVAIVVESENTIFLSYFNSIADFEGQDSSSALFNSVEANSREVAEEMLRTNKVHSVFVVNSNDILLLVSEFKTNEMIAKNVLDNFKTNEIAINNIMENGGSLDEALAVLSNNQAITNIPISDNEVDYLSTMFFALIGMVCIYFAFCGVEIIKFTKTNQSIQAQRITLSSTPREKVFLASYVGMFLSSIAIISFSLFYINVILGVNLGNMFYVGIIAISGIFAGIGIGMALNSIINISDKAKDSVMTIGILILSFLAGMMGGQIKETITNTAPILNYINPVALIVDAFTHLTYFNNMVEFWIRIGILLCVGTLTSLIAVINLRRNNYASI